jgi:hypothetical protein
MVRVARISVEEKDSSLILLAYNISGYAALHAGICHWLSADSDERRRKKGRKELFLGAQIRF